MNDYLTAGHWAQGLVNLPWYGYLLVVLVITHITIVGVTLYLHRHQAHRALDLHPIVSHGFRFWLWLTTGIVTREWVAVHRKHHAKCESPEDPHSPQMKGISQVFWQGAELYRAAAAQPDLISQYSHGTPDDWLERHLYQRHSYAGIVLMLVINVVLFGFIGLAIWAIQMMWIPVWAAGVVNGIGHYWGYRNFETPDASRNLLPVGILIGGEELHNNHHAFASAACFSQKPWELDIGWAYIRLLAGLRLARVKKLAPRPRVAEGGEKIDKEALTAIVVNRMHVMADYAQRVLWPVLRQTQRPVKQGVLPFRQARKLLVRDPKVMDAGAHGRLEAILARCQDLRTVYQYRQRLQAVWDRKACSHEALLAALQEWCAQAEATGIQVLEDFALRLRGYRMAVI